MLKIASKTLDKDIHSFETLIWIPVPAELRDPDVEQWLNRYLRAYDKSTAKWLSLDADEKK